MQALSRCSRGRTAKIRWLSFEDAKTLQTRRRILRVRAQRFFPILCFGGEPRSNLRRYRSPLGDQLDRINDDFVGFGKPEGVDWYGVFRHR
jgi:hypothetical protein